MRFEALELSYTLITELRPLADKLRRIDSDRERQLRRAASSVPENLSEGSARRGKDRTHHYRIAAGSARETESVLRVCHAWGYLRIDELRDVLPILDRLHGLLWGLTH